MFKTLSDSQLFKGIEIEEIENLLKEASYSIKKYNKNQRIILRGDKYNKLMIIISGSVRGEMQNFDGKIIKIEDIKAPQAVASGFLFGNKTIAPVDITTNENSQILFISKRSVLNMMQNNSTFLNNFLASVSAKTQFLSQKLWILSFKTIKEKLAYYILDQSNNDDKKICNRLSQQTLADYFGVTRPSLSRIIGEFVSDNIIKVSRKKISILNKEKLLQLIKEL